MPVERKSALGHFLAELRRRRVVRFSVGYAAAAFVVLQLAEIVFPAFGVGEAGLRVLVVLVALGFLPALVLAWIYDVTREGIKRTEEQPAGSRLPLRLTLLAFALTSIGVTAGVGWYLVAQGVPFAMVAGAAPYDPDEPIRSLAVLPLEDFSPEGGQEYFAAGMHEELIAQLSGLQDVRVVSRTTVMRYANTSLSIPEIGRELGVDVVIEGSVNRSGDQVRITLQVIHAASDSHIETIRFERGTGDVLGLQSEVADAVAVQIAGAGRDMTPERTAAAVAPAAQDAYLRGKYELDRGTPEGHRRALGYFQEALEADADFGPAMAGLAGSRFLVGLDDPESGADDLTRAREDAARALELDSGSLEVQDVLALIERSIPRMITEAPSPPDMGFDTAWVGAMTSLGHRIEERVRNRAIPPPAREGERRTLDARLLMSSGRYTEASLELERVVASAPERARAWEMLARSYVASGDPERAAATVWRWQESGAPGAPDARRSRSLVEAVERDGERGYWAWTLESLETEEADGGPVEQVDVAAAHAALGDHERALELLARALESGERGIMALRADPVWDDLRGDARFRDIERQARQLRLTRGGELPGGR